MKGGVTVRRWVLILGVVLALVLWTRPQSVDAATSAVLNIDKRVTATSESSSQETVPLAGARYQVTRIQASGGAPIDAAKPATYRVVSGAAGLSTVLTTDADGLAQLSGLALGATYLVQELAGPGVDEAADPVVLVFDATHATYTYTPKSGLTGGEDVPHAGLPDSYEDVGNGTVRRTSFGTTARQPGDTILQTGGQVHWLGLQLLSAVLSLLVLGGLGAVMMRRKQLH